MNRATLWTLRFLVVYFILSLFGTIAFAAVEIGKLTR